MLIKRNRYLDQLIKKTVEWQNQSSDRNQKMREKYNIV